MASFTQAARKLGIGTPDLGSEELILQSFDMTDEISRPFVCEVTLYSGNAEIKFDDIVGQNVTLRLDQGEEGGTSIRYINGYVSRFVQGGGRSGDTQHLYYATVVPWLWFLTRATDCKIYQDKTIPEIIEEVFSDFGCSELVEDTLTGTYDKLEYVVQYRETAFNFVSRLMEHEGIYYFFKHENGKHKLVLADAPSAHETVEDYEEIPCQDTAAATKQGVTEWTHEARLMPGKYSLRDFDFKVPKKDLNSEKSIMGKHTLADFPIFDYPGDYIEKASGDTKAESRMEELAIQHNIFKAKSDARGLVVGCKFKLTGAAREAEDAEYVITSMKVSAYEPLPGARAEEELFRSEFTCVPADQQIRPTRRTPKPLINGPQTAIVTGPSGEEILTDEHGRVKVHFHWDRWNAFDDKSSCWIRVAQLWAGKSWGAMFIPRVNQEVIVEFLEGDPDRPIITGRVYNGDNTPPYALPGSKNISGIKSDSTKGGGGYNEFSYDDTKGSEKITIHAQKDMTTTVEHDMTDTVKNDRAITVDGKHTETIKLDTAITVSDGKLDHKVMKGTAAYYVKDALTETYDNTQTTTIKQACTIHSTDASVEVHGKTQVMIHTGDSTQINMLQAGKIGISAKDTLQLSCGPCVIEMKSDGTMKLSATKIEVSGAQEAKLGVSNQNITCNVQKAAIGGAAIDVTAVGMNTIAGAVVKIN
jgi:type VI secretion system secreted protein VgrG